MFAFVTLYRLYPRPVGAAFAHASCTACRRASWLVITRAAAKTFFVSDKRGVIQVGPAYLNQAALPAAWFPHEAPCHQNTTMCSVL